MAKKKLPETSLEAFRSLDPTQLAEIYRLILWALSQLGEGTFEEIAASVKKPKEQIWKRLSELSKMDLIYRPGNRRVLRSGRTGFTWMLTQAGLPKTQNAEKVLKGKTVADYSRKITEISKVKQTEMFLNS